MSFFCIIQAHDWTLLLSSTVLLAVVAALGYMVGRQQTITAKKNSVKNRQEISRALTVARELEAVAARLRRALATNLPAVGKFQKRLTAWEERGDVTWHELCDRADELLKPALKLSAEVSNAYAEILQAMSQLATFAELRTDPLTGISNRRAFDESLGRFLADHVRHDTPLAVAMLDVDFFKRINDEQGHLEGDRVLQELAQLLRSHVRQCDVLARYGGEEFVILMPYTDLPSACNLSERLRAIVQASTPVTVSLGLATSVAEDTSSSLLMRADGALYAAKGGGRNRVFYHEGPSGRLVSIQIVPDATCDAGDRVLAVDRLPLLLPETGEKPLMPSWQSETA